MLRSSEKLANIIILCYLLEVLKNNKEQQYSQDLFLDFALLFLYFYAAGIKRNVQPHSNLLITMEASSFGSQVDRYQQSMTIL